MYRQSSSEPPWGDNLIAVSSDTSSNVMAWIADHPLLALALALVAGFAVGKRK